MLLSRHDPVTGTWSELVQLSDDPTRSEQNPILFQAPGGPLWLLWTAQLAGNQYTAIVRRRLSVDDGHSWGPMEALIDTPGTFVRQPPVVLAHGDSLLPIFLCMARPGEKWVGSHDTRAVLGFPAIKAAAGPSMPCPRAPAACTLAWICVAFIARASSSAIANACR